MADEKLKGWKEMLPGAITEGAGTMGELETGSWRTYVPVTDLERCTHCMICWISCPESAIEVKDAKKLGTNLQYCKGCGICANVCPPKCIEMVLESTIPEGGKKG
jgi:2-oxoacid:acceptor oxidoreductase delta subunit (pyruvate/2-ketoisovalerate family)